MSRIQTLLREIGTRGHTPERLLELAVLYDNLGQTGSAYIFYLRFLESFELGYNIILSQKQDIFNDNSKQGDKVKIAYCVYIRLGLLCEKMKDRVFNATSWYERAMNYRPDLPFAYYFMSRIIEQQGKDMEWRWQKSFNYANLGCNTIGNYYCFNEKYLQLLSEELSQVNVNYPGHHALFFQRSVAASWLKDYRTTAIEDLRFILRRFNNIDDVHYKCTLRNLENLTGIPQYSKNNIQKILDGLEGWCSKEKVLTLINIIEKNNINNIVEIGVYGGSSLIPMMLALKNKPKDEFTRRMTYAIDAWDNTVSSKFQKSEKNVNFWENKDHNEILQKFKNSLIDHDLSNDITILPYDSNEALDPLKALLKETTIDLLHIDGNHSEEQSLLDVQNYLPLVSNGGFIILDDVHWEDGSKNTTKKAFEFLKENCKLIDIIYNTDTTVKTDIAIFKNVKN